jgi:predicted esterase
MNKIYTLILLLLLAACSQTTPPPLVVASPTRIPAPSVTAPPSPTLEVIDKYEEILPKFEYNSALPFDIEIISEEEKDGAIIQDVTYTAYNVDFTTTTKGRINAYIVKPSGNDKGSYAGVLFLHQLEKEQNRKEFLNEAILLAQQGTVSVLPDGVLPWKIDFTGKWKQDQENIINQVIEIRRSLDLLIAQPGIDPQRISCVGHDYGAMHASLLAAVDERVKTYVLMTGDSTYSNWALRYFVHPDDVITYREKLAEVDPINFIAHANPDSLFFQFAETDGYISQDIAELYYAAASEPKQIKWYKAGHNLNEEARQDRIAWLTNELNLSPVP